MIRSDEDNMHNVLQRILTAHVDVPADNFPLAHARLLKARTANNRLDALLHGQAEITSYVRDGQRLNSLTRLEFISCTHSRVPRRVNIALT